MTLDVETWKLVLLARILECEECGGYGRVRRTGLRAGAQAQRERRHKNYRTRSSWKRCLACGRHNQLLEQIGGPRGFLWAIVPSG